jgi:HAD-superfamily hydrolase, subfamily IIB
MGERMVKLIASDLDGTLLLNGAREVSEKVIDYIKKLNQYGVVFAAASGRQYPNLKRLFGEVCEDIVYICENGAFVKYKGETLSKTPLDKKLGLEIMKDIYEKGDCEILLSGEETSYLMPKSKQYVDHIANYVGNNICIIHDLEEVKEDYIKISVYEERGILNSSDYFHRKWGNKVKTTISGKCWLDFVAKEVNKGEALKNIQQIFHILKEDTMCFGDSYNDLEMFENSLYSYAMTSANSEIRAHAKYVTTTVESILYDVYQVLSR